MTTVGYGDLKAAQTINIGYESGDNMLMISFMQFMAILMFTLIKHRLFSLHFDAKLE